MYMKCSKPEYARQVFDEMPERDVVSWSSMISGCRKMGLPQEAIKLFMDMREQRFEPDEMTLVSVLAACGDVGNLSLGKWVEEFVHKEKLELNTSVGNSLIRMYMKCSKPEYARQVFDEMPERDVVSWKSMILGCTKVGFPQEAIKLFVDMREQGLEPDEKTLCSVLEACGDVGNLSLGKWVEEFVHKEKLELNTYVGNSLIAMYMKCSKPEYARQVFDEIPERNVVSWTSMISGCRKMGLPQEAIKLFMDMREQGFEPDEITLVSVLAACGDVGNLSLGKWVEEFVHEKKLELNTNVGNSLIRMYMKCSKPEYACQVFDEMPERDVVSWKSMILGCTKVGFPQEAIKLFMDMREQGLEPDEKTLCSVLEACGDVGNLSLGKWVEEFLHKKKFELNTYVGSSLIGMYGKCGDLLSARKIFDAMAEKDVITWNSMITGYSQNGESNKAITLFNLMRENNIIPDEITIIVVLSACASIGALDLGKSIEIYASQQNFEHHVSVGNALIDMYAKCGTIENAIRVFESMPYKDKISWNAMISAFAFNGRANEAISLFRCILTDNTSKPDDITLVSLLTACVHAGLVDEGCRLFYSMSSPFGLVPKIEHYSCMVDLLGRAGHLDEAWNLIEKMPGKPNAILLGSLLSACQKRGNLDISERVTKMLLEMEPLNSSSYIIQSQIYANLGMWDESGKMKALISQQGVTKLPGCSWIEIGSGFREFHAGDVLDDFTREMYRLLIEEMKREGYVVRGDLT